MTKKHSKGKSNKFNSQKLAPVRIPTMSKALERKLARVKLLAMDVDGVLTDGTLAYDNEVGEQKRFHVADGLGIVLLRYIDVEVAWISGRASVLVERRAKELGVNYVMQGVRDKCAALNIICASHNTQGGLTLEEIAYIGDDWNDLPALGMAGVSIAVANAASEVKAAADVILGRTGGQGAVRDAVEMLLAARGQRATCMAAYLASLENDDSKIGQ